MALFRTGAEGFRAISAKAAHHKTLFIFPDNLRIGSSVVFHEPTGTFGHRIDGAK
jgi:hypothetical protein